MMTPTTATVTSSQENAEGEQAHTAILQLGRTESLPVDVQMTQPQLSPINNQMHGNTAEKQRLAFDRFLPASDEEMK